MRSVSELYSRHTGEDIYVVGSGTSIRVFPPDFFEGKVTIGLNLAWKSVPVRYAITIHPDLNIPEFIGEPARPEITWIVPREKSRGLLTPEQFAHADAHFFKFEYHGKPNTQRLKDPQDSGRILDWVRWPTGDNLYVWSSIAQTAANLAANLGARSVILAGCDSAPLMDNHHAHTQHTRWKGVAPEHRYGQYYEGMAEVRAALRDRGVNVVSLQPFLGISNFEADFKRLCGELGLPLLIEGDNVPVKIGLRARLAFQKNRWMALLAGATGKFGE
jgi:hypothetical protein